MSQPQYPHNEAQERADFAVGGQERTLPPEEQLAQLASYIHAHYEAPAKNPPWSEQPSGAEAADTFDARLPDRITHAAMLMLGAAVDHHMPGVAFGQEVSTENLILDGDLAAQIIRPRNPNGAWAISLHPGGWWKGSGVALENSWRPEVAAVAELSGITFLDLDYPLVPEHTLAEVIATVSQARAWVAQQNPTKVFGWGYSSGGALAVLSAMQFDAVALTFPHLELDMLPAAVRGEVTFPGKEEAKNFPPTFLQYATHDAIASHYPWFEELVSDIRIREYVSEHRISTPEVARQRVQDVAEFLRDHV